MNDSLAASSPAVGRRLRYTNREIERAAWLLAHLPTVSRRRRNFPGRDCSACSSTTAPPSSSRSTRRSPGRDDPALAFGRERLAWPTEKLNPLPLLDGSDLIRHGLAPGPDFARLLETVRDAQLNGEIHSRDEALALVDRLL